MTKKLPESGKVGRPIDDNSPERAREIHSMGGIASGIAKRKKKLIKETLEMILCLPIKDKRVKDSLKRIGIVNDDMTQQTLMSLGVLKRAQTGDPYAAAFIRDSIGQKEAEKLEVGRMAKDITEDIEQYICGTIHTTLDNE